MTRHHPATGLRHAPNGVSLHAAGSAGSRMGGLWRDPSANNGLAGGLFVRRLPS